MGRSPMGSRVNTPAGSPTHSPRTSVVSLASQYIPRVGIPIAILSPRHASPSSSRRTSYASQTISPLARNVLTSQISTVSQGSHHVGSPSDEDDEDPPPYSIDLPTTRVSLVSQYSQPAGNISLEEEDPPPYSALVDLGIVDDFTPEPTHAIPDELPRVSTSSDEPVPMNSIGSPLVPTSSDASRQVPTSSGDSRRASMNSNGIGQEQNRSRVEMNGISHAVPETESPAVSELQEIVWTLRSDAQRTRSNEFTENIRNSTANLCDTSERHDVRNSAANLFDATGRRNTVRTDGSTNNSLNVGTAAVRESPWTLRQPEQHSSAARHHAARAGVRDDESAGEAHVAGASRLEGRPVVRRAHNPRAELKTTDRESATGFAKNFLRSEESVV